MCATQILAPAAVQAEHDSSTATPIQHVVVIFGENISFDHYFGTYPYARNSGCEPRSGTSYLPDGNCSAASRASRSTHNPCIPA
ncbi:MAG TPA: alkaline phosphatase family protein [Acidobacteriaceae bacterium]